MEPEPQELTWKGKILYRFFVVGKLSGSGTGTGARTGTKTFSKSEPEPQQIITVPQHCFKLDFREEVCGECPLINN
jgi:hypothetical protein